MIEIGAAISLGIWILFIPLGIAFRFWTPTRFFLLGIMGSLPLIVGTILQAFVDGRPLLLIPVLLIIIPAIIFFSYVAANRLEREPWRRMYRVKHDSETQEKKQH
jgi:hypothetical protein